MLAGRGAWGDSTTTRNRSDRSTALASATGLIRSEVGKQTGLKHTPSISFTRDTVPDTAKTIEDLVAKARAADAAVAAVRDGAVHAGDPDPYRVPDNDSDEDSAGVDGAGVDGAAEDDWVDDDVQ